jgi:hypothetical protein
VRFSGEVYSVASWPDKTQREPIVEHDWRMHRFRPLGRTWSQIESLAGSPDNAQVRAQLAGKGE